MQVKGVVVVEDASSQLDAVGARWPEALEHVANKPIPHHVLDVLEAADVQEVIVASSAELAGDVRQCLAARQQRTGLRLRFVERPAPLSFGDALRLAAPIVGRAPCIVHVGTGLLGETLEPVMARLRSRSPDAVVTVHEGGGPDRRLNVATEVMLQAGEFHASRAPLRMAGICLFGPGALRCASTAEWRAGNDVDLTGVAERVIAAGGSFYALPVNSWRRYAGDPLDLLELNRIALDRLDGDLCRTNDQGNRIEGRVWIHERATVRASVIVGPVVIGPGARVEDAYIGPYTSIGAGARIEGAEIERSIIAAGASITHVGGRLVASVVGRNARIFRDFSLPRALRLRVGDGTEVALC